MLRADVTADRDRQARFLQEARAVTQTAAGTIMGIAAYMSPEQRTDRSGGSHRGGDPEQVTPNGGQGPVLTADNAWLYYTKADGVDGLWRRALGGGNEQRVVDAIFRSNFALTATGVYFGTPLAPDGTSSVRFLEFSTGSTRDIVTIDKARTPRYRGYDGILMPSWCDYRCNLRRPSIDR